MKIKRPALSASVAAVLSLQERASFYVPDAALNRWNSALVAKPQASEGEDESSISIYDVIGYDYWTGGGVTAKRIAAALRNMAGKDVVVNINSPGGDLFEGVAIYNLLRDHKGKVTTRVVGLAASAASLIAMAGDEIQVARAGFMMIHNVWVMAIGNRNDLRAAADQLEPFDDALADVYSMRTGMEKKEVAKLMDKETWFSGSQAIEKGFADAYLPADQIEEKAGNESAERERAVSLRFMPLAKRRAVQTPRIEQPGVETRNFSIDKIKVEDRGEGKGKRIVGHAAVFNQWSEDLGGFRERILPGAFKKALQTDDVRALFNHNENFVLGRNKAGTLVLEEDAEGLAISIDLPDTQVARDLAVSIERGDIDQMSFAFQAAKDGQKWERGADGVWMRDVSEVSRLWDVSPVTFAAYPQTDAALRSMRSLEAADRQQIAEREAAERSGAAQAAATEEQEKRLRRARLALAASS